MSVNSRVTVPVGSTAGILDHLFALCWKVAGRRRPILGPMKTAAIAITAAGALAFPTAASALTRQFEGSVVSVNRDAKTFRIHDSERGTKRIKVVGSTDFEDLSGFSALKSGLKHVEVTAKRRDGRWIASVVERSGGSGHHGDDD